MQLIKRNTPEKTGSNKLSSLPHYYFCPSYTSPALQQLLQMLAFMFQISEALYYFYHHFLDTNTSWFLPFNMILERGNMERFL